MLLYTRHYYYQLFRSANKASNRIFSSNCWRSSSTIFDGQCSQIQQQNKNFSQFHCQFPFQDQKLCQRYQFYSTGNDGIHPLPVTADDGTNSSLANESENSSPADDSPNFSPAVDESANSSSLPDETANTSSPADGGENNSPLANESENSSSLPNKINDSPNSSSLPDENANSSSSTALPKIPTTNAAMEQKEQHKIRTIPNNLIFNDYFRLSKSNGTVLKLRFAKGKRGHKFFEMSAKHDNMPLIIDFGKILFPEDAYAFVRALDELILELATKNVGQKLLNQGKSQSTKRLLKVRTVEMIGKLRKFQLELLFFPNEGRSDIKPELCILLLAFKLPIENNNSTPIHLLLPLRALPWLREQMADMLVRHDDRTETIAREAPAKIPNKYLL